LPIFGDRPINDLFNLVVGHAKAAGCGITLDLLERPTGKLFLERLRSELVDRLALGLGGLSRALEQLLVDDRDVFLRGHGSLHSTRPVSIGVARTGVSDHRGRGRARGAR
jgi:hypothetical protein